MSLRTGSGKKKDPPSITIFSHVTGEKGETERGKEKEGEKDRLFRTLKGKGGEGRAQKGGKGGGGEWVDISNNTHIPAGR